MTSKIIFVLPSFAGGGAERVMVSLANALDRERFSPSMIVLKGDGPLKDTLASDIDVIDLRQERLRHAVKPLAAAIRKIDPYAVVPTMGYLNLGILMNRKKIGSHTKIIVREANEIDATIKAIKFPWLGRFLYKRHYPRADRVITPTRNIALDFRDNWGVPAEKLSVLRNPVDLKWLREMAGVAQREPGTGLRFVASGRLVDQKGFDRLIEWLVEMPQDTHLTIFGEGPMGSALRHWSQKMAVAGKVRFAGFVSNPWVTYAGADAFLLPSRWEGMSNASLEALAVGTPVIGTPHAGGLGEVATQAAQGAVTLAAPGEKFIDAMMSVKAKPLSELRPSLLPEIYSLERVTKRFQDILTA
jgi:glycosyltransferase involved in cell wall biosynthesis